jgi:hypothetical protein
MVRRIGVLAAVALGATVFAVSSAHAALFFLFKPTSADAGDLVTARLGGTPASFEADDGQRPYRTAIRLYLVPSQVAGEVGSRFDRRLHFVGRIVPDRNSRGILRFRVPPLDTGAYALAYWCPGCAQFSGGTRFGVQTVPEVSRYRRWMALRVRLPAAAESCPATTASASVPGSGGFNYGNGLLASTVPTNGVVVGARWEPDGSLFWKPGWLPRGVVTRDLVVAGERLDASAPPMRVLGVRWGGGSWRTASTFPSEGCWRITGRVGDISLSYVVKVVAAP